MIAQFSRSDEMRDCEERAEHDADPRDDDIGDAEKWVLATYDSSCGYDDGFCTAVFSDVKV